MKSKRNLQYLCFAAVLAAITTVATAFIKINTGINNGYVHLGDTIVYLSGALLPPPFAALSSAIGGALADVLAGAPVWAPATAVIKALNTVPLSLVFYFGLVKKKDRIVTPLTVAMTVVSGLITVFGYLLAEGLMYSFPSAWASAPFSVIQASGSTVLFVVIGLALDTAKFKKRFHLTLDRKKEKTVNTDIIYTFSGKPYLNLTSKCPCSCTFCIRQNGDGLGSATNLWHKGDPTLEEITTAIDSYKFKDGDELTWCGYGEPTMVYDNLIASAKYVKEKYPTVKLRLNTNGLSDRINGKETAKELCEVFDCISVSLNTPNSERYDEVCRPKYEGAYDSVKKFIADCVATGLSDIRCSVVDVITEEETEQCVKIAEELGAKIRVRVKE